MRLMMSDDWLPRTLRWSYLVICAEWWPAKTIGLIGIRGKLLIAAVALCSGGSAKEAHCGGRAKQTILHVIAKE